MELAKMASISRVTLGKLERGEIVSISISTFGLAPLDEIFQQS
ncbi:MAG: hypothetical protein GQ570_01865 [Helicobacteraceae bacterium]|nr:hypothetical protein [Helicobacteraceae bacterium]